MAGTSDKVAHDWWPSGPVDYQVSANRGQAKRVAEVFGPKRPRCPFWGRFSRRLTRDDLLGQRVACCSLNAGWHASVFPPPKHAQVKLQSTSVSTCVDTEASFEILETARVAPTDASTRHAITTRVAKTDARNDEQGRDQETALSRRQLDDRGKDSLLPHRTPQSLPSLFGCCIPRTEQTSEDLT